MDALHQSLAELLDGRPVSGAAEAGAVSAEHEALARRVEFDRLMDEEDFDEALAVAQLLLASNPADAANLVRKG